MKITTEILDKTNASHIKAYKSFFIKHLKENSKIDAFNDANFEKDILNAFENIKDYKLTLVYNNKQVIAVLQSFYNQFLKVTKLNVLFLKDANLNDLSFELKHWFENATQSGKKTIFDTQKNWVSEIAKTTGFIKKNEFVMFKLLRKNLNKTFISNTLQNFDFKKLGINYQFIANPNFEIVKQIVAFKNELFDDMLQENKHSVITIDPIVKLKQIENCIKQNQLNFYLLCYQNENLIGMCETKFAAENPKKVNQYMTGTKKNLTGNGIATWMKALLYDKIFKEYKSIETVLTDCFSVNYPMIKINNNFGFVAYELNEELVFG